MNALLLEREIRNPGWVNGLSWNERDVQCYPCSCHATSTCRGTMSYVTNRVLSVYGLRPLRNAGEVKHKTGEAVREDADHSLARVIRGVH